jgi:holo-[acyl-carrier protein] synthase
MTALHGLADVVAGLPGADLWGPGGGDREGTSSIRVGIDLVLVPDVVASVGRFGDHYVDRIFTPHEVACCLGGARTPGAPSSYSYESLAARFAAKEAVVKVLRPVGARPEWRDIEVYRAPDGWTEIRLSGQAAVLAAEAGIDHLAVSLTHEASTAAAVVVGVCRGDERVEVQDPKNVGREEE